MEKATQERPVQVKRVFEQPSDAISFYSDIAQVMSTGNEVLLQFYETIPGPPSGNGQILDPKSYLRATITVSVPHALSMGKLLLDKVAEAKGETKV